MGLYDCVESPYSRLATDDAQQRLDETRDLEQEILSRIFEEQRTDSLHATLSRAGRAAAQVRERLSSDMLRVLSQLRRSHAPAIVQHGATSRLSRRWRS